MKEYLYKIQPTRLAMLEQSTPEEDKISAQHFAWLKEHADKGTVLLAGRTLNTDETSFGIVIFRAESDEAAQKFLKEDPGVNQGIMHGEVYPYRVALLSETYPRK